MEDMRYKSEYIQCSSCVTFQSLMQPETAASHAALISGIFLSTLYARFPHHTAGPRR